MSDWKSVFVSDSLGDRNGNGSEAPHDSFTDEFTSVGGR